MSASCITEAYRTDKINFNSYKCHNLILIVVVVYHAHVRDTVEAWCSRYDICEEEGGGKTGRRYKSEEREGQGREMTGGRRGRREGSKRRGKGRGSKRRGKGRGGKRRGKGRGEEEEERWREAKEKVERKERGKD